MTSFTLPRRGPVASALLVTMIAGLFFAVPRTAGAQQPYAEGPLLQIITGMREGTWKRVNANSYSEAWTPDDLRPLYNKSNHRPEKIIGAWSSYAWDSNRGCLIIYGGGHANYSGNDVYRWCASTLKWERAALPSEIKDLGSNVFTAIDGVDRAPTSAHTYDNAVFLPLFDRYMNFGGALFNTGGPYVRPDERDPTVFRRTGPYLFDPSRADAGKVGGSTGSHVKRVSLYPEIKGGLMWDNRDIYARQPLETLPLKHVAGCTAYSYESDAHDVVYVGARGGGTALHLYRYQITDVTRPSLDKMTQVGIHATGTSAQTTCAHDPVTNIVLRTGVNASPFYFWDLATAGPKNRDQSVAVTGSVQTFVDKLNQLGYLVRDCGMDYDQLRARFVMWCGGGEVWSIKPPNPISRSGWQITQQPAPSGAVPPTFVKNGILGKWEYIPGFDVFIGLEGPQDGNIWVYKPVNWEPDPSNGGGSGGGGSGGGGSEPAPGNQAPVVSLTSPTNGTSTTVGSTLVVSASASDPDGSIAQVAFRVNQQLIGITNVAPYSVSWKAPAQGTYSFTAEATDNKGATTVSAPVSVSVVAAPSPGDWTSTVLRRHLSGYTGVADTYLSRYYPDKNYGPSTRLEFAASYVPMFRFAIFAFEGGPIPNGATIDSAKVHIYKTKYDDIIALHAMLRRWTENEATWNQARAGVSWSVPGAAGAGSDYRTSADAQVSAPFEEGWIVFDVTSRVRAIANGGTNHGWRMVSVSTNKSRKEFHSSELGTADLRPRLEVRWQASD